MTLPRILIKTFALSSVHQSTPSTEERELMRRDYTTQN